MLNKQTSKQPKADNESVTEKIREEEKAQRTFIEQKTRQKLFRNY